MDSAPGAHGLGLGGGGRKNRSMENGADRNVSWYGCEGAVAEKNIDYR